MSLNILHNCENAHLATAPNLVLLQQPNNFFEEQVVAPQKGIEALKGKIKARWKFLIREGLVCSTETKCSNLARANFFPVVVI